MPKKIKKKRAKNQIRREYAPDEIARERGRLLTVTEVNERWPRGKALAANKRIPKENEHE